MKRLVGLAAALLLASGPAFAAAWTVDPARSTLGFSGSQVGAPFSGRFQRWTATVDYDPAKPDAAHVRVTIDMASATTGDPQRDEALPGGDWFDTARFPKATFEATGFVPKGPDSFETPGRLAIRGIGKDVTLPFTLRIDHDTAHATGTVNLVRTAFGVGQGDWASDQYVALDVNVAIDLTATRQP